MFKDPLIYNWVNERRVELQEIENVLTKKANRLLADLEEIRSEANQIAQLLDYLRGEEVLWAPALFKGKESEIG